MAKKIAIASPILILVLTIAMWGYPQYRVYVREMHGQAALKELALKGEAELKKAEHTRQIALKEAEVKKESATLLAEAEIERAKGVAEANKIIGDSLRENEQYLRYLWVQGLQDGSSEVIYIPTEAGMPILEAGRTVQ